MLKIKYLDTFIEGLNDNPNSVIHIVLQALDGVEDIKTFKILETQIAEKFPTEKDYILVNLNHTLKPLGLNNRTIKIIDLNRYENNESKKKQYWFCKTLILLKDLFL